jgi:hypothetical protein
VLLCGNGGWDVTTIAILTCAVNVPSEVTVRYHLVQVIKRIYCIQATSRTVSHVMTLFSPFVFWHRTKAAWEFFDLLLWFGCKKIWALRSLVLVMKTKVLSKERWTFVKLYTHIYLYLLHYWFIIFCNVSILFIIYNMYDKNVK